MLACAAIALAGKTVTVEICKPGFCYMQRLENVRKAEYLNDFNGNRFVRVTFDDGRVLDLTGDVTIRK